MSFEFFRHTLHLVDRERNGEHFVKFAERVTFERFINGGRVNRFYQTLSEQRVVAGLVSNYLPIALLQLAFSDV